MTNILPDEMPPGGKPDNPTPAERPRPAVRLQIDVYREPGSPLQSFLLWELITPAAPYHQKDNTSKPFTGICYDLNAHILQALAADFRENPDKG